MDYVELNIPTESEEISEILTAELAEFPFESFLPEKGRLKAYIPQESLAECMDEVNDIIGGYGIEGFRYISIETQNWNAQWESNFEQVEVGGDKLLIRAPFHQSNPKFQREVVIMPKMSFGTGHHATTHLMAESIIDLGVEGMAGLDMGSGTGVLAIVAVKCGAKSVDAIDIDEWAYENCKENIEVNGVADRIDPLLGDVSLIGGKSYDFICANINRNILLAQMPSYRKVLKSGGVLLISGFLECDIEILKACVVELGMTPQSETIRDGWVVMKIKG